MRSNILILVGMTMFSVSAMSVVDIDTNIDQIEHLLKTIEIHLNELRTNKKLSPDVVDTTTGHDSQQDENIAHNSEQKDSKVLATTNQNTTHHDHDHHEQHPEMVVQINTDIQGKQKTKGELIKLLERLLERATEN